MNWTEIIHIRVFNHDRDKIAEQLPQALNDVKQWKALKHMRILKHASLETDMSICLMWQSKAVMENGSDLGLSLAQMMKDYGMVHHSVWIDADGHK